MTTSATDSATATAIDLSLSLVPQLPAASQPDRLWTSRSTYLDYQRCKRLRFLAHHAGSALIGLSPKRKSIHLVIGGAVHGGLAVLLRDSSYYIDQVSRLFPEEPLSRILDMLFIEPTSDTEGKTPARLIEDDAVAEALRELQFMSEAGVELDSQEKHDSGQLLAVAATQIKPGVGTAGAAGAAGTSGAVAESAINVSFDGWEMPKAPAVPKTETFQVGGPIQPPAVHMSEIASWPAAEPLAVRAFEPDAASIAEFTTTQTTGTVGWYQQAYNESVALLAELEQTQPLASTAYATPPMDPYLTEELRAQVESMVRAYARRRLRVLLTEFEVLEVEREGEWHLTDVLLPAKQHQWIRNIDHESFCVECGVSADDPAGAKFCENSRTAEIWFASRHDALLRERSTGFLYLQSYKTTGSWDRRKEAEAQIDMQGLSEAVDVDRRLAEAWQLLKDIAGIANNLALGACDPEDGASNMQARQDRLSEIANPAVVRWLATLPTPPQVLGVRYEYLIKGARRQDKKDVEKPGRYVCESPLIRAYQQAGITAEDRRWSPCYEWWDLVGKGKRVDYRSWSKAPVWRFMTIEAWIDLLDSPADPTSPMNEKYDQDGNPLDILAEQFVNPIHVYRNSDDMADMIQQLQSDERSVAESVALVHIAAASGDFQILRSALNIEFPQNRRSCVYPGRCEFYDVCYGPQQIRENPEASELYVIRTPNHPNGNASVTLD
jgi:hypothetical protein